MKKKRRRDRDEPKELTSSDALNTTSFLVEKICSFNFRDIPDLVVQKSKQLILDNLGVTLAGSTTEVSAAITKFISGFDSRHECTIIGTTISSSPHHAALANAISAHALDFDDALLGDSLLGHPTAVILPPVLALGETLHASGRSALGSYIVGVEFAGVLGRVMNPEHYERGYHSTSTIGIMGAAVASAKMLGLRRDQIATCIGIAASMAAGLRANFGTMTKSLQVGLASQNGLLAALLAKEGISSRANILEVSNGYFCALGTKLKLNRASSFLKSWNLLDPGVTLKPYPSCAATHPVIDATRKLAIRNELTTDSIKSIAVSIPPLNVEVLLSKRPKTGLEGKFSAEFCAALALTKKDISPDDFSDTNVKDPSINWIMDKVTVKPDLSRRSGDMSCLVTITTTSGKTNSLRILRSKGSPENPLSDQEVESKFASCAIRVLERKPINEIVSMISSFEKLKDLRDLFSRLGLKSLK